MYLVLFSIVLYRTIVTVYTDKIVLLNYLQHMHQKFIFHRWGVLPQPEVTACKKIARLAGLVRTESRFLSLGNN